MTIHRNGMRAIRAFNPGGFTHIERSARDILRRALAEPENREAWLKAYMDGIKAGNPLLLKDYADRVLGKPKDTIALESENGAPLRLSERLTPELLLAQVDRLARLARGETAELPASLDTVDVPTLTKRSPAHEEAELQVSPGEETVDVEPTATPCAVDDAPSK